MKVHSALGNGFQEARLPKGSGNEMAEQGIDFTREHEMQVFYKNQQIGTRRVDFLTA